jgi:hypothetical protein
VDHHPSKKLGRRSRVDPAAHPAQFVVTETRCDVDYRSKNLTRSHWPSAANWLWSLGERLFAAEDARARDRGWQVEHVRGGLGRTYRDPRYDRRTVCGACGGTGHDPQFGEAQWCVACRGVGVVTRTQPTWRRHIFGSSEKCGDLGTTEPELVVRQARPTVRWSR